jgi:hypothetical protein
MGRYSRKAWLASIYHSEKSSTKLFSASIAYITCQLSSVQSCTRNPIRNSLRETKTSQRRKLKTVYAIRTQISKLWYVIYHTLCTSPQHEKRRVSIRSLFSSMSQFGAIVLLNQWREVHVCYIHVHHKLGNVVDRERYAAIRNSVLMRINVSSGN